jgi:vacuolar iron transporter family protein
MARASNLARNRTDVETIDSPQYGRPDRGVGHYLRDIVNGACDGVVTTVAIVAGATGAAFEPRVSILLGIVNLAADGLSMGASNYLGLKSELEQSGASVAHEAPLRHGLATAAAFVLAGGVPLLAFALGLPSALQFPIALALALATLAFVGGARSGFTRQPRTRCALEMVAVGGAASAVAYGLGLIVEPLLH